MSAGGYSGSIAISSNGGNGSISVNMGVEENPALSFNPSSLDFGFTETTKTFDITNSGNGTLTWNLSSNQSWLKVAPINGNTINAASQITVAVDRTGLNAGNYSGSIAITSNGGNGSVSVNIGVEKEPVLSFNPSSLDFGLTETTKTFDINNSGGKTLTWSLSSNQP